MSNKRFNHLQAILAGLIAGGLLLAGCTSNESKPEAVQQGQSSAVTRPTSPGVTHEEEEEEKTTKEVNASFLAAADLSELEVEDSTVVKVETEKNDDLWEVKVIGLDGTAYRLDISADDGTIVSDIRARDTSNDKRQSNLRRLAKVDTSFQEAAQIISDLYPGVKFVSMDWEAEDGKVYWEATLLTVKDKEFEVTIDALTGEVADTESD